MVGIYRITSPSGKIYIGQSRNIYKRWGQYRGKFVGQLKLANSFKKYGVNNHLFEIIHFLPIDISKEVIDGYENLYIIQYKEVGFVLMNGTLGGGSPSEDVRKRISQKLKGTKQPQEVIDKRTAVLRGLNRKATPEFKKKLSKLLQGNHRNSREVYLTDTLDDGESELFHTVNQCAERFGVNSSCIRRFLQGTKRIDERTGNVYDYSGRLYKDRYKLEYICRNEEWLQGAKE